MKSNDKYVLCFDMQKLSGTVHKQDVEYLVIKIDGDTWTYKVDTSYTNIDSSMFTKTYGIEGCTLTTTCPADLTYSSTNNESFTHTQESLYFITHIEATTNVKNNFSAYLTDVKGLSKESIVTNQRHKLAPPLFSEDDFNNSVISQDTGDNADGTKTIEVQMQKIDASVAEGSGNNTVTENVYINYTVKQGGNTVEEGKVLPETDGKVKIKLHPGINQVTIWQTSPNYINSDFNTFDTVKVKREQVWVDSTYTGTIITGSKKYPYTSLSEASDELANTNNSIADPRSSNNKIFIKNLPNSTEEISLSNMKTCTITSASSEKYEVKQKLNFNTTSSNVTLKNLIVNNNTINSGQNITIEDCKINGEEFKLYVNNSSTSERTINNSILPKLDIEHSNCSVYINNSTINGDIVLNKGTVSLGGTTNLTAGTIIQINNSSNSPTIKFSGSLNITGGDGSGKVKLYVENTSKNIFTILGDINIEDFNNYFTIVDADGNEIIGKELYKADSNNNVKIRNIVDSATVTLTTKKDGSSTIFNINLIAKNNIVEIVPTEKMTGVTYTLLVKQGTSVIISEDSNTPSFKYDSDLNGNYDITICATVFRNEYSNNTYKNIKTSYQIGDVITKDGNRIPYVKDREFTADEKANAAAVIFRIGSGSEKTLGVAIKEIGGQWATRSEAMPSVDAIICSYKDDGSFSGDTDGSDNWEAFDKINPEKHGLDLLGNGVYYGVAQEMTGSVQEGWFIPTIKEIHDFYQSWYNEDKQFKNVYSQLINFSVKEGYDSSSQNGGGPWAAQFARFCWNSNGEKKTSGIGKWLTYCTSLPVHQF